MDNQPLGRHKDFTASATKLGQGDLGTDDSADPAYSAAMETLQTTRKKISEGYELAVDKLKKAETQLETSIKENPILALGIAAGLGWLVGHFVSRRLSTDNPSTR